MDRKSFRETEFLTFEIIAKSSGSDKRVIVLANITY